MFQNVFSKLLVAMLFIVSFQVSNAQSSLATWDMNPVTGYGLSPMAPTTSDPNVTIGGLTRGSGLTTLNSAAARAWGGNGWSILSLADGITNNKFFTFTAKANTGYALSLNALNPFDYRRTGTGPDSLLIQYSLDGTNYNNIIMLPLTVSTSSGSSLGPISLSGITDLQNVPATTTVTFRLIPHGGTGATGNFYIFDVLNSTASDLTVDGSVTAVASCTIPGVPVCVAPAGICVGSTATIVGGGAVPSATTYTYWTAATGGAQITSGVVGNDLTTSSSLLAGTYSFFVQAENSTCISTSRQQIDIQINDFPIVSASASVLSVCYGDTTTLSGNGASTYTWMPGNLTGSPTVNLFSATTYTVTGTDAIGCATTTAITINVNTLPSTSITASPGTICEGNSSTISGSGGVSYTWMPGNLTGFPSVSPSVTTTYTMTVTDANGCTNSSIITVNVNPAPLVSANVTDPNICPGQSTTLNANGAVTYAWMPGNLNIANPTITPLTSTTYTMTGTDGIGCQSAITVFVNVYPQTLVTSSNVSLCDNIPVNLVGSPSGGIFSVANPYSGPSTTYTYTYTDINGCVATSPSSTITSNTFIAGAPNPEILYYKFDGTGTTVPNLALTPPVGTTTANILGSISQGNTGQSGSALIGSGALSGANYMNTHWNTNLTGSWTISFWLANISPTASNNYIFGDNTAGSFRCLAGTLAGTGNIIFRSSAFPDLIVTGATNAPCVITFVYNSVTGDLTAYKDGVFNASVNQLGVSIIGTAPLKLAGYFSTSGLANGGKIDEFRIYNRALSSTEILNVVALIPPFALLTPSSNICSGASTTLNAIGANSYLWNPGGSTSSDLLISPTSNTTYTVTGTDANGCTGTLSTSINVNTNGTNAISMSNACKQMNNQLGLNDYYDSSCDLLAKINSSGNLGATEVCVNLLSNPTWNGEAYSNRVYSVTPTLNNISSNVCLYYTATDLASAGITSNNQICITKVGGNGILGGTGSVTEIPNTAMTITNLAGGITEVCFPVSSFSSFYCHTCNPGFGPLPVSITNFSGEKINELDLISWTSENEQNNGLFNILYSQNGNDFKSLGTVHSKAINGTSNISINYEFKNAKTNLGHNYYQIEQVDLDGKTAIHQNVIDLVRSNNGSTIKVFPNPVQTILNIDLYVVKAQNTSIKLVDMSGRLVKEIQLKSVPGLNQIQIDLNELASGLYTMTLLENGIATQNVKVIKK